MDKIQSSLHLFKNFRRIRFSQNVFLSSLTFPRTHNVYRKLLFQSSIPFCYKTHANSFSASHRLFCSSKSASEQIVLPSSKVGSPSETDDESFKKKTKEDEFRKRTMKYAFIAFGVLFSGMAGSIIYEWGSPLMDDNENPIEDEFSHMHWMPAYALRTYKEVMNYNQMIKDPSRDKLLPEPLTDPYYQPPYTLVLEMTGILVHPDWTYKTGWRFKKRPGIDYFLQQVGPPLFEVVIFTSEQGFTAFPILDALDSNGYIMYRLFRDSTRYMNGHHVKDLSCINRDLSKVIYVDWNPKSFSLQPKNALMVEKWNGDDEDKTLFDLADMLRTIGTSEVEDVRSVLEYYSQFGDKSPVAAFRENRKKLKEEEEKRMKDSQGTTVGPNLVSGLLKNIRSRQ